MKTKIINMRIARTRWDERNLLEAFQLAECALSLPLNNISGLNYPLSLKCVLQSSNLGADPYRPLNLHRFLFHAEIGLLVNPANVLWTLRVFIESHVPLGVQNAIAFTQIMFR
jgi:hypothetical protein